MVLTDHQERGFEFPGGKIERDETVEDAAMREVREETGGIVKKLVYLGQYQVTDSGKTFWKTIYFSILDEVEERSHYYETGGPVYMQELPVGLKADDRFSFIMKDEVVTSAIQFAIEQGSCHKKRPFKMAFYGWNRVIRFSAYSTAKYINVARIAITNRLIKTRLKLNTWKP